MTILKIQSEFTSRDHQFIAIDALGNVAHSDNNLVDLKLDTALKDFHSFFEIIPSCFETQNQRTRFECVHLNERIFDIDIINNGFGKGAVILREGTDFYQRLQKIAQKRNEFIIFSEVLGLKNEILKEKEEFKDKFIGNFAHELRNPLTLITAFSSLLLKTDLNVDQEALVKSITGQGKRLQEIIDDIVDLSILKRQFTLLEQKQFNLYKLIEEIRVNNVDRAVEKGAQLIISLDSSIPQVVMGDERRLGQILTNALDYAIQFNEGNEIKLQLAVNQRRANKMSLTLTVLSKTGTIPEKYRTEQTPVSDKKGDFSSLGLSVAAELLHLMDGSLGNSVDMCGNAIIVAKLKLQVPLHIGIKEDVPKQVTDKKIKLSEKIKVLIAEDYGVAQLTAIKVLVSTGNFATDVYANPKVILEAVQQKEYDIILMSSSISQIDATELLGMIREFGNDYNRNTPAIALTTQTKPEELKLYRKAGFKDIVKKPYTDDEVLSTIYKRLNLKKFK